ncbi:MAG: acyl-CoA dehydrogenase family protein [Bacteroidota bacterium]|nr:acyl-CoA dehydrogenase family protein [Bacteroidota bacterium]
MSLIITEEEKMLKEAARELIESKASIDQFRLLRDQNYQSYDSSTWNEMINMGWTSLIIPEKYNGLDFSYVGMGQILEEMGRKLTKSPLMSSILFSATAIRYSDNDDLKTKWFPKLMNGETLMTLAIDERSFHDPKNLKTKAKKEIGGYRVKGKKTFVSNGNFSDHIIVVTKIDSKEYALFLVKSDSKGVKIKNKILLDTSTYSEITFDNVIVPAENRLDLKISGERLMNKVLDISCIGLSSEMLGIVLEAFELTINYLKEREQFGIKIGSFQSLQHRAAKLFSEIELCKTIVIKALQAIDQDDKELSKYASLAKAKLGKTIKMVTNEAIQMHGGIGVTDDSNIGFYLKRARVVQKIFGDYNYHLDKLAKNKGY